MEQPANQPPIMKALCHAITSANNYCLLIEAARAHAVHSGCRGWLITSCVHSNLPESKYSKDSNNVDPIG